ncbi:protein PAT1 homolog 1 isoform X3 [Syngnathoides biaculeatus]|uniref:protein PAT1 homolog 1 isoform X3 n=1 Tax=Syngnathoides biaculeatus TaxID=300417 RepID=UPI002ADD93AA|nr:protein PAT1 homolog 1 isoform X3 [Syngnathoides biaculeatus]
MFRFQSLDDDCTLEEEVDGLVEEEDEIDQFNDDTFGAGAVDDDWQEEHKRLAELDERDELGEGLGLAVGVKDESELGDDENSSSTYVTSGWGHLPFHPPRHSAHHSSSGVEQTDLEDGRRESDLAESLARMVLDADPAIAGVGTAERPISSQNQRSGHDSRSRALHQPSTISHSPYPHQHPQQHQRPAAPSTSGHSPSSMLTYQQQQHLLRSLPGTIGQMNSRNIWENRMGFGPVSVTPGLVTHMEIHHPTAVHVRANIQQRYPPPFPERLSPNTLLNFSNAPLCRGPFPPGISPVLSQIQRAQLLNSQVAGVPCGGPVPPLVPAGGGFRPFFSGPHPTHSHRMAPLHSHGHPSHMPPLRHNATHLHPQHRRILTQRMQNRGGDRSRTGGDWRSRDPYSNLMTQKEKEWVTKIQMMQLQSTDPFLDDYYYQHYYEKMEKRQEKERDSSKKEHTTKLITPQVAKIEHTYRPVQFAGSLGKLTVSSVNNPRKMIDAVVTTRSDDEEKREKQVWNKRRQILYTVEKIYSLLLEVQDFEKRYVHAPEEDRESLLEQHKTNTVQLCNSLQEKEWDDRVSDERCVMIMSVRKGKRLISRLLPYLPTSQAAAVVMAIARNLPTLAKKDKQDQVLCWLVEPVSAVVISMSSTALTDLLQELQGSEGQLVTVLHNKFGVTLLYLILSEGERMQSSNPNCQLMDDNRWTDLVFSVTRELLNIPSSSLSSPLFTPSNLLTLFSRFIDHQRLDLLQEKLQITDLSR